MTFEGRTAGHIMRIATLALSLALAFACLGCSDTSANDVSPTGMGATDAIYQEQAAEKLASMTLEQKVAQLFIVRPEDIAGEDNLVKASKATTQALAENTPGGICYFARNLETPDQTRALLADTQAAAQAATGLPLLQCVDEEGGMVSRIAGNPAMGVRDVGPAAGIGARGSTEAAYEAAADIADYLLDLGFNVDFAPVCDIADGKGNTIGQRSFGTTADAVAPMAQAQVKAFGDANILCSAKHFPGIGGVSGDSHEDSIHTQETLAQLEESELVPFRAAIEADVPLVMVGHLTCPAITGDETPASLAPAIYEILRDTLGYQGVAITDSLEMDAISENYPDADQAALALAAGTDLVLLPNNYAAAYQGVLDAIAAGTLSEEDIDAHAQRVVAMKLKWGTRAAQAAETTEAELLGLEIDPDAKALPEAEWGSFLQVDERTEEWARAFAKDPAVRLKVTLPDTDDAYPSYYRDPAVILAAFNAMAQLDTKASEDTDLALTFTMPDSSEKRLSLASAGNPVLEALHG